MVLHFRILIKFDPLKKSSDAGNLNPDIGQSIQSWSKSEQFHN